MKVLRFDSVPGASLFLEHHLEEEEEDLFPRFKKYVATSTRKKMGDLFLKKRKATRKNKKPLGALASGG